MMTERSVAQMIKAMPSSDGAGVKLKRSLGQTQTARHDPFLMLDEFRSDEAADYIGGFPAHPHRGFETVTYMLAGAMRHEDSLGNRGHLRAGDIQWMTAGRGIVHSEMPEQEEGLMHGFQLWINLPARDKMNRPRYQDIPSDRITEVTEPGRKIRVIAGDLEREGQRYSGPVSGISTEPVYLDVTLDGSAEFGQATNPAHNVLVYVFAGSLDIAGKSVPEGTAALLTEGERLSALAGAEGARFLMLSARPIGEPIVQYGPFVMNSREEIEQAIRDYQSGAFATDSAEIA